MKSRSNERIEHHTCPPGVAERLRVAGGTNTFGDPNFRLVWGYDRIVPIHGEWQEFEQFQATLTDKVTGYSESRLVTKLVRSVVETRMLPKYLPGNCWHLEKWCPPEDYGSPEQWGKLGQEVIGMTTIDTAGPYPERGEYELCNPLTHDGSNHGDPLPLVEEVVVELVRMIVISRERFSYIQRRAAIEQRLTREENGWLARTQDMLKDGCPAYSGQEFVTVLEQPSEKKTKGGIIIP